MQEQIAVPNVVKRMTVEELRSGLNAVEEMPVTGPVSPEKTARFVDFTKDKLNISEMLDIVGRDKVKSILDEYIAMNNSAPELLREKFRDIFDDSHDIVFAKEFLDKWKETMHETVADAVHMIAEEAKAKQIQRHEAMQAYKEEQEDQKKGGLWKRIKRALPHATLSAGMAASAAIGVGVLTGGTGWLAMGAAGAAGTLARRLLKGDKAAKEREKYAKLVQQIEEDIEGQTLPEKDLEMCLDQVAGVLLGARSSEISDPAELRLVAAQAVAEKAKIRMDVRRDSESTERYAEARLAHLDLKLDSLNKEKLQNNNVYDATNRLAQSSSFFGAIRSHIASGAATDLWLHDESRKKRVMGHAISMTFGGVVGSTVGMVAGLGYERLGAFLARSGVRHRIYVEC